KLFDLTPPLGWIAHSALQGPEIEELFRRQTGIGVELLRQESDGSPKVGDVLIANGNRLIRNRSAGWLQQAAEDSQQSGLAGAIRSEQPDDAGSQIETHAMQGAKSGGIDLGQVAH